MAQGKHARHARPEGGADEGLQGSMPTGEASRHGAHASHARRDDLTAASSETQRYSRSNYGTAGAHGAERSAGTAGVHGVERLATGADEGMLNVPTHLSEDLNDFASAGTHGSMSGEGSSRGGANQVETAGRVASHEASSAADRESSYVAAQSDAQSRTQYLGHKPAAAPASAYAHDPAHAAEHAGDPGPASAYAYDPIPTSAFEAAPASAYASANESDGYPTSSGGYPASGDGYAPYGTPTAHSREYDEWARGGHDATPGATPATAAKTFNVPEKRHGVRKALRTVLIIVLALLVVAGAAVAWYLFRLDQELDLGDRRAEVEEVLSAPVPGEPYYILLIGSDSREGAEGSDYEWAGVSADGSDQHADAIMLARVDEENDQLTLLSIPRDTAWQFDNGTYGKFNYTYTIGNLVGIIEAVKKLTGVPISHVVEIHMSGLIQLIDTVGGVDVNVPVEINYHEALTSQEVHLDPGVQTLNGMQAEVFARERLAYEDGDVSRQSAVRTIVQAILDKVREAPLLELPRIVLSAAGCVDTDMRSLDALHTLIGLGRDITLYQGTGPTAGDMNPYASVEQWLCYEDPEGWDRVIEVFMAGGDPSTVSYEGDNVSVAGGGPVDPNQTDEGDTVD